LPEIKIDLPAIKRVIMIQNILDRKGVEVITIAAAETVRSAADRMRALGIAALVVKSGDAVTGLVCERYKPSRGMARERLPWRYRTP
jgi:CBS domain-containing protein